MPIERKSAIEANHEGRDVQMYSGKAQRSVLIVSSNEKTASFIMQLLDPALYHPVVLAKSGNEASRILIASSFDIVIINSPLSDGPGYELALNLHEKSVAGILLMVKNEIFDEVCDQFEDYGILTVSKPLSKQLFYQALRLIVAIREKLRTLEKENVRLQVKIQEIRIINRAKWTLIEYLKMSEAQAHRYIEKQAMDMRITKRAVAESILKTYESL